jgi:glutamine amidotransferase
MTASARIGVIDYSAGNLTSMFNALDACGVKYRRILAVDDFKECSHLILPGVGAFRHGMDTLVQKRFVEPIREAITHGTPFLGVCLGMQLLFEVSNEFGTHAGLSALKGEVKSIKLRCGDLPVPHVGWNDIVRQKRSSLLPEVPFSAYFVHSFFCECTDPANVAALTDYGAPFCSVVERNNLFGVQFHPEKSHAPGLSILKRFAALSC